MSPRAPRRRRLEDSRTPPCPSARTTRFPEGIFGRASEPQPSSVVYKLDFFKTLDSRVGREKSRRPISVVEARPSILDDGSEDLRARWIRGSPILDPTILGPRSEDRGSSLVVVVLSSSSSSSSSADDDDDDDDDERRRATTSDDDDDDDDDDDEFQASGSYMPRKSQATRLACPDDTPGGATGKSYL